MTEPVDDPRRVTAERLHAAVVKERPASLDVQMAKRCFKAFDPADRSLGIFKSRRQALAAIGAAGADAKPPYDDTSTALGAEERAA